MSSNRLMQTSTIKKAIKLVGPVVSIFSFFQFVQPFLPSFSFWTFELGVLAISILGSYLLNTFNIYRDKTYYAYTSPNSKLILQIYYGDLFQDNFDDFLRVIPMDYDLDTSKVFIRSKSIQFQFREKELVSDSKMRELLKEPDKILGYKNFIFLRIAKFNSSNNVELDSYKEYFSLIHELCKYIDKEAHGRSVVCSVIGGNVQFKQGNLSSMQRLQLFKLAVESYSFQHEVTIHIVMKKDRNRSKKYNLLEL